LVAFHPEFTSLEGRYAKALYQTVNSAKMVEHILAQGRNFLDLLHNQQDLNHVVLKPLVNRKIQQRVLKHVLRVCHFSEEFTRFILLIARHGRLPLVKRIFESLEQIYFAEQDLRPVTITTAVPAEKEDLVRLTNAVKKAYGNNIEVNFSVDPSLVAGYRIMTAGKVMDASLSKQLKLLKHQMIEG